MSNRPRPRVSPPLGGLLVLVATALISVNLRPGATSIGPLLAEIRADLGIGSAMAGVLTALPGFTFALAGAVAVSLAHRFGLSRSITLGLACLALALLARVTTDSGAVFLALTALGLAGMGLGNVLVPAWIKTHARGRRVVQLMTVYGMGLTIGGAVGPLLAAPTANALSGGWRPALGLWGLTALVALLPWLVVAVRDRVYRRADSAPVSVTVSRSPTALALTALFGIQSTNAYVQFGWLPQIYRDAGLSATSAGAYTAIVAGSGVVGGLLMPTVIHRSPDLSRWMITFGSLAVLGYLGLLVAPAALPWLWAILLGISGFAFPTAISLITARSRDPRVTAQLSGFVQPVGYLLAGIGPFLVGLLYEATGGWTLVLVLMMTTGLGIALTGMRVARPVFVDDELETKGA